MCRNIKTLFNFDPPATDEEIRAASLQFVRKLSGFNAPSKANEAAFDRAIDETAAVARRLIDSLSTNAAPRNREEVAAAAKLRSAERFGAALSCHCRCPRASADPRCVPSRLDLGASRSDRLGPAVSHAGSGGARSSFPLENCNGSFGSV
jgi:hypothetical protein